MDRTTAKLASFTRSSIIAYALAQSAGEPLLFNGDDHVGAAVIGTPQSIPRAPGFAGPFDGAAVYLAKARSKSMSSFAMVGPRPNCPAPAARKGFGLLDAIELAFADQLDRRAAAEMQVR